MLINIKDSIKDVLSATGKSRIYSVENCSSVDLKRSYINEVSVNISINNVNIYCLLDSGSESSIIGKDYVNKYFPNWESFPDYKDKPLGGKGVDGSEFTLLGTKLFTI